MKIIYQRLKNAITTLLFFCMCFMFFYCNNPVKENKITKIPNLNNEDITLKKRILSGDTMAYFQLRQKYFSEDRPTDFLFWALIMANKYKYNTAYYDVFFCIEQVNRYYGLYHKDKRTYSNFLDSITNNFAKEYLNKLSDTNLINKTLRFYQKDTLATGVVIDYGIGTPHALADSIRKIGVNTALNPVK